MGQKGRKTNLIVGIPAIIAGLAAILGLPVIYPNFVQNLMGIYVMILWGSLLFIGLGILMISWFLGDKKQYGRDFF